MRWLRTLKSRSSVVAELMSFLWRQRLWWLIPTIVMLLLFGLLMLFAQSSPLAPFIYSLF